MLAAPKVEPTQHQLPYAASVGAADRIAADERYERVRARFAEGTESLTGIQISDRAFVDHLLFSLLLDFDADVDEITGSQWFRVRVIADNSDSPVLVEVQCDSPVDGLVTIWDWLDRRAQSDPKSDS